MSATVKDILDQSSAAFGTSGYRGLVDDLTDRVCFAATLGFLAHCAKTQAVPDGAQVFVAHDLRPSSPRITSAVVAAIRHQGLKPVFAGKVPTPALALAALERKVPGVMITGSHIPFDRNGIKFYGPGGEITKVDERAIARSLHIMPDDIGLEDLPAVDPAAETNYKDRYKAVFGRILSGKCIGLYQHSAVGRDVMAALITDLGADVIALDRSDVFVPVDTEDIAPKDREQAKAWSHQHGFDALISTDGDGDRPLLADERGHYFSGDILGILSAGFLGADTVITPVSANTAVERCGWFDTVTRTRIGSPHVLAGMENATGERVVGFEPNGGFLTQSPLQIGETHLAPLPTRDAVLPILSAIAMAVEKQIPVSGLLDLLPRRVNRAGRLQETPREASLALIARLQDDKDGTAQALLDGLAPIAGKDVTDGLRLTLENDEIVHLRPSGNAPECRIYVETGSETRSRDLLSLMLDRAGAMVRVGS